MFTNGGTTTAWPLGGSMVTLVNGTGRLLPSITPPPESAGPRARATINVADPSFSLVIRTNVPEICAALAHLRSVSCGQVAYEQACTYRTIPGESIPTCPARTAPPKPAVRRTWGLPKPWYGKELEAVTLTPNGTRAGPALAVDKAVGTVALAVTPGWPVTLTLKGSQSSAE